MEVYETSMQNIPINQTERNHNTLCNLGYQSVISSSYGKKVFFMVILKELVKKNRGNCAGQLAVGPELRPASRELLDFVFLASLTFCPIYTHDICFILSH